MKNGRNYPLLLASQFLSAFGDNAILAVIVGQLTRMQKAGVITEETLRARSALYTMLLFVPYIFLAPLAGYLNDRYAKTSWLVGGNAVKLLGTLVCGLSIWLGYEWQIPGYLIVGVGSCLYGPAKYGILPEILASDRLVKANGTVELLTLLAIIVGAVGGAAMIDQLSLETCYAVLLGVFGLSLALNKAMQATRGNPMVQLSESIAGFGTHLGDLFVDPRLARVLVGTGLFWVCGAAMKINFQAWGLGVLNLGTNLQVSLLGLWLSVGVMAGSMTAGQLHRVGDLSWTRRYGFLLVVTLGLIGTVEVVPWLKGTLVIGKMTFFPWVICLLVSAGFAAGLFLIPLNAALQAESDSTKLGKTIAVQNLIDNIGMLLAGGLVSACVASERMVGVKISAGQVFFVLAGLVLLVLLWLRFPKRTAGSVAARG
jgi:LPLT family lysophospholipid transporter-like MFS transporter